MGTRKSYSEEIKWKAIELKKQGYTNKEIMEQLGIKNKAQIKTWMKWQTLHNGECMMMLWFELSLF